MKNIINEGSVGDFLKKIFGKSLRSGLEMDIINLVKQSIKKDGKSISLSTLRKTPEYKKIVGELANNEAKKMGAKDFNKLTTAQKDQVVTIVNDNLSKAFSNAAEHEGASIAQQITSKEIKKTVGNLSTKEIKNLEKEIVRDTKKITSAEKSYNLFKTMSPETSKTITKLISNTKSTKGVFSSMINSIKNNKITLLTKSGKLGTVPKNQLKGFTGLIRRIIVPKTTLGILSRLGITGLGLYLIFKNKYPNEDLIITDENGNDVGETPTNTEGKTSNQWSTCIQDLIKNKSGVLSTNNKGVYYVVVKNTGDSDLDSKGGVIFFTNGKIQTYDKSKTGSWSCKGGQTVVSENIVDLDIILENIYKINNMDVVRSKSIINEQTTKDINGDVEKLIDYFDFPVTQSNLQDAYNLLLTYKNDPVNASALLKRYNTSGLATSEMETSVKNIYTTQAKSGELKDNILALISEFRSGKSTATQPTTNTSVLGGINIYWNKVNNSGSGGSTKKQTYKDCTDFPFEFGCRNKAIKEIQIKIGLPEKWQTGNFGPITKSKLIDSGYYYDISQDNKIVITRELYNKIIGQTQTGQTQTTSQTQTAEYSQEEKAQQDTTRENQYIQKNNIKYNEFKNEYIKANPNESEKEIRNAFIKNHQEDFIKFANSPGTYDQGIAENINEIKIMFKKIL